MGVGEELLFIIQFSLLIAVAIVWFVDYAMTSDKASLIIGLLFVLLSAKVAEIMRWAEKG